MSAQLIGFFGFLLMLVMMLFGVPVAVAMTAVGLGGFALITSTMPALNLAGMIVPGTLQDYTFAVIPLFLLMGEFADMSGMMRKAYDAAVKWLGGMPGGLAMASILGAAAFSAVSGSSLACAILMTRVALPNLLAHNYKKTLAVGTLASGGTLGNLVPPGVLLIVYALLAQVSIAEMMVAAVVPGMILTVMYLGLIYVQCRLDPEAGPAGGKTTMTEKLIAVRDALPLVGTFSVVTGGIWLGIFTAFEAAAIGTLLVFLYAQVTRQLTWKRVGLAFKNTVVTTGMIFAIIIAAHFFTSFIAVSGLARGISDWVSDINAPAMLIVFIIMMLYFVFGTALEAFAMLLLTLPIFIAIVKPLGVDLVWFGILVIVQMELSNITPPVGLYLFGVAGMVKKQGIPISTVYRGVLPFALTCFVFSLILFFFPQTVMTLVHIMRQ